MAAAILITIKLRAWWKRRKNAAYKISNWGKRMIVKIRTKKEIGWDDLVLNHKKQ